MVTVQGAYDKPPAIASMHEEGERAGHSTIWLTGCLEFAPSLPLKKLTKQKKKQNKKQKQKQKQKQTLFIGTLGYVK